MTLQKELQRADYTCYSKQRDGAKVPEEVTLFESETCRAGDMLFTQADATARGRVHCSILYAQMFLLVLRLSDDSTAFPEHIPAANTMGGSSP